MFHARPLRPLRTLINQHRLEATKLFKESDPFILHQKILDSKPLNLYSEARSYPYTSLKYHILLSCALYYNLKNGSKLKDLYFCETRPKESPFQIIYQDSFRTWAIAPLQKEGIAKIHPKFYLTWERRRKISFGGDHQIFDELLTTIGSWTVALATVEDFFSLINT